MSPLHGEDLHLDEADLASMPADMRMHLIHGLPGFKTANLIGTADKNGQFNLAIFANIFHLGSNPALLGIKMRPVHVPRHTYENIRETGFFTVNYIHQEMLPQAHETSAKFAKGISEFEQCGLTPLLEEPFPAPFVSESKVRIGLRFVEEVTIQANEVKILVGQIEHIFLPAGATDSDGRLQLDKLGALAIGGADSYYVPKFLQSLPYGSPKVAE